jgi:putative transferase (TIGR04331 family)
MKLVKYIVSDLRKIKDPSSCFFQCYLTASKYKIKIFNKKRVADFIDKTKSKTEFFWKDIENRNEKYIKILRSRLNKIHNVDYSIEFWKRVFSISLLINITHLYQFYIQIKKNFDPSTHFCEILSKKNYCYVDNFEDQRNLLYSSHLGQEQLLSLYINFYYKEKYKEFSSDHSKKKVINFLENIYFKFSYITFKLRKKIFDINFIFYSIFNRYWCNIFLNKKNIKIGILGSFFSPSYFFELYRKSNGKIAPISIPQVKIVKKINFDLREIISSYDGKNLDDFDKFFFFSLKYLMPKVLVEGFNDVRKLHAQEIKKFPRLTYILSEAWLGSTDINLFRAFSYEQNCIKTLYNEHNCIFHPFAGNFSLFISKLVDKYLTFGWKSKIKNTVPLASLFPFKISSKISSKKKIYKILYVSYSAVKVKTLYTSSYSQEGFAAIKHLNFVEHFFKLIPVNVLKNINYRPYPDDYFLPGLRYDKEKILKKYLRHVNCMNTYQVKTQTCKEQMSMAGIVVIDSISTAYLEALMMNIPTLCLFDKTTMYLNNNSKDFFDDLIAAKIFHKTPKSAAKHLLKVYREPLLWWNSKKTQNLKDKWLKRNFGEPKLMLDYLQNLASSKNL